MKSKLALIAPFPLLLSSYVWACATCFGDPNDPQTRGLNAAILTLLAITYGLFGAMFVAGFVIWRRNRRIAAGDEAAPESTHG